MYLIRSLGNRSDNFKASKFGLWRYHLTKSVQWLIKNKFISTAQKYLGKNIKHIINNLIFAAPCTPDEEYHKCLPTCPKDTCEDSTKRQASCSLLGVFIPRCKSGCACKPGLFRNKDNKCVPYKKCREYPILRTYITFAVLTTL